MLNCNLCGRPLKASEATFTPVKNDNYIITCPEHTLLFDTCHLCQSGNLCDFETNPSRLPKMIQKQIQQGPMTQIIQMKNPDRVAETCAKNCPCYNPDYECGKNFGVCGNYSQIPVKI